MPTYEYACRDCGQHLEVVQSFRDAALSECPSCAGRLRKVYGAAGIIFKGSGYYVNDSRAKAAKAAPETPASGNGDSGSESKTETKPEAKPAKPAQTEKSSESAAKSA